MALHQQRQAKCRQVRAASMAQQQQLQMQQQQQSNQRLSDKTEMAADIREFYRTPTMLAEDVEQSQHVHKHLKKTGKAEDHEARMSVDGWRVVTSTEDPSSTSYDVHSLVDEPGVHGDTRALGVFGEGGGQFDSHAPIWLPSGEDRRTPTLPWTSSLDVDTLMEVGGTPTSVTLVGGGRRKSTKKTPAPPPPPITRSQTYKKSSSDSSASSLT